ncbi:hypothetical protein chiPu_0025025 [Chiloscyllium punctatum]|uniref:Uncharacterized protein n=1 Tax=Chiloscyllium punctatum TaxID=137246 RepID=A0A401TFN9_CHIPU|nr:hypothetical protein [Chiloscyllium punctatum]
MNRRPIGAFAKAVRNRRGSLSPVGRRASIILYDGCVGGLPPRRTANRRDRRCIRTPPTPAAHAGLEEHVGHAGEVAIGGGVRQPNPDPAHSPRTAL